MATAMLTPPLAAVAQQPQATVPAVTTPLPATPAVTEAAIEADPILPRDLTPIGMFMAADKIVKTVMIGLALASVLTWSVWLAKTIELAGAKRRLRRDLAIVEQALSLRQSCDELREADSDVAVLARAAAGELRRSGETASHDGIKERVGSLFARIEAAAVRRMTRGTGLLATIGAIGPFVGLFGTVWGIMNAFIGISKSQTTNLAVVAPGIAEALLATALGLVAAIPAVVIFNMFSRAINGYRGLVADGSAELMRMVSRDLDVASYRPRRHAAE
jgi:biopolymer transport protein ExbB